MVIDLKSIINWDDQHSNKNTFKVGEGTQPWAIFRFRIFSNYFSQKFEKIKITV